MSSAAGISGYAVNAALGLLLALVVTAAGPCGCTSACKPASTTVPPFVLPRGGE